MELIAIADSLTAGLKTLRFGSPVTHVYNPLEYARDTYCEYLRLYGYRPKEIVLIGMNPGPWGMAQTGVPFGEVETVRGWLGIEGSVGLPAKIHPKRPVQGFSCTRSEVSGRRMWGWARETFATPQKFFARFFVVNYCPLLFIDESGKNRTPNNLRAAEREPLLDVCDRALRLTIQWIKPRYVIGVGHFTAKRLPIALSGLNPTIGRITHPSPANPKANRGWHALVTQELQDLGIEF